MLPRKMCTFQKKGNNDSPGANAWDPNSKNQRLGSNTEFVSLVDPRVGSNGLKLGFHQKGGSITTPVFVFTVNGAVPSGSVDLNIGYPIGIGETIKRYIIYIYIYIILVGGLEHECYFS